MSSGQFVLEKEETDYWQEAGAGCFPLGWMVEKTCLAADILFTPACCSLCFPRREVLRNTEGTCSFGNSCTVCWVRARRCFLMGPAAPFLLSSCAPSSLMVGRFTCLFVQRNELGTWLHTKEEAKSWAPSNIFQKAWTLTRLKWSYYMPLLQEQHILA